jgi:hypothetical protein
MAVLDNNRYAGKDYWLHNPTDVNCWEKRNPMPGLRSLLPGSHTAGRELLANLYVRAGTRILPISCQSGFGI